MESCLTDLGKTCVEKSIHGAIAESRHVFCFTWNANEFEEEKVRLKAVMKKLEQRAKVALERGYDIQDNFHFWKKKADKFIQEDIKTKQTCFFGLCPDCIWRYKKGKELANNIEEIKRLTEIGENFVNIGLSSKDYISFHSRESKYRKLLDALTDDNNFSIVLQGMGGIGKTTLAKEVGRELKLVENFAHVIITTVSFTPDIKKIQDEIAGSLGLEFEDSNDSYRPGKLWRRLTNGEKILLIMDDVWDQAPPLDFDLIGIPKRDHHKGCKVLITTRSKRIFNIMDYDKTIGLELLSEEDAWTMFKRYANISNSSSKSLITMGFKFARECKQLPLAIVVIASNLKGQHHHHKEWDVSLKFLKEPVSMDNVDDEKVGVYKCLKFSYDFMKDETAKGLFLLSSVFPEGNEIHIEILVRLCIGTGVLGERYDSYDDIRNQVVIAKNKLIDSCLLMEVDDEHVKMHDMVREAAQWIANNEIQSVNAPNKDKKSSLAREINIKYLFCKGMNKDLFSHMYDGSKLEILIVEMERDEDRECMEVPNSFFENIVKLRVLYFSGHHDERPLSLPHSIQSLENIRSILVEGVDLGDISVLGNLQSLETLDLVDCTINELPHEIAMLEKFKVLNLEKCEIRRKDPFEVIKRCSPLEELYFITSFNDFCREMTLPKLHRYRIRKGLSVIDDSLSKYVVFNASNDGCFFSKETFKYCMQTAEGLQLDGIKEGWRNLMPEIVPIDLGMNKLVELHLKHISQLQYLIHTIGSQVPKVFSKLVVLELNEMENLEELFSGSISFDSLKNLRELSIRHCKIFQRFSDFKLNLCNLKTMTLWDCPMLVSLSPLLTSRNLVLLEKLKIYNCKRLTSIITDEIDDGDNDDKIHVPMYPELRVLNIEGCHQLKSILPCLSFQDFPVLEVISIKRCDELKYIFGQYQHVELSSLKQIELCELPNFISIFSKYSHSMSSLVNESSSTSRDGFKETTQVHPIKCKILSWSCISCHGYRQKQRSMSTTKIPSALEDPLQNNSSVLVSSSHRLQIWELQSFQVKPSILCNVKEITLSNILEIKSVLILSSGPIMLVETLTVRNCRELKHIIVDIEDYENGGKNWGSVFPRLKRVYVQDCMQLKYIFGHYTDDHPNHNEIHLHLPALQCLELCNLPSLVAISPKEYWITFPPIKELDIAEFSQDAIKPIDESIINHSDFESPGNTILKVSNCLYLQQREPAQCLPIQSNIMCNIIGITLFGISKIKYAFMISITPRMSVETLRIENCDELKHIILDIGDDENGVNNGDSVFPKLKRLFIKNCMQLKYIFGHYTDDHPNHNEIHLHLPELQCLELCNLPSFVAICHKQYRTTFRHLEELILKDCSLDDTFPKFLYIWERAQCLLLQSNITNKVKEITLSGFSEIKSVFMLSITSRMLVESLRIENCNDLKHIIVDIGDDDNVGNNQVKVFPNLKRLRIVNCLKLEYIFEHRTGDHQNHNEIHLHLPALQCLELCNLPSFVAISPKRYHTTFSPLKELELVKCSMDNTIMKELSGRLEHFVALESLKLHNSIAENILCLNEIEGQPINLGLQMIELHDLYYMMYLFVGPENSFSLQNLTQIKIVGCERLEIIFSTSILRCLSQLIYLTIENCKELKHIIKDEWQNQNLSSRTCFPKLKTLVVIKCHKLKCVFSVSICKELPELETLMISEANELEEIFKIEDDQEVEILNLDIVVLVDLPKLFPTQGIQFQAVEYHFIQNCQNLSSTLASTPSDMLDIIETDCFVKDFETLVHFRSLFERLQEESRGQYTGNENSSVETTKDVAIDIEIEVEAALGNHLTSSQIRVKQIPEAEHKELSSPYHVTRELDKLVSMKLVDYENLPLLTDFLVKHPSVRLRDTSLSNRYKGYAYNRLAELLKFLQTHSVLDVLGSNHSEFLELLSEVRECPFDKDWLDGVEKHTLLIS